jgi:hypothetical protein
MPTQTFRTSKSFSTAFTHIARLRFATSSIDPAVAHIDTAALPTSSILIAQFGEAPSVLGQVVPQPLVFLGVLQPHLDLRCRLYARDIFPSADDRALESQVSAKGP